MKFSFIHKKFSYDDKNNLFGKQIEEIREGKQEK